jgi:para-aminobenzoate synthetase component 1
MPTPVAERATHDLCLWRTDGALVQAHGSGEWTIEGTKDFILQANTLLDAAQGQEPHPPAKMGAHSWAPQSIDARSASYIQGVKRILKEVRDGNVYQVNLAWEQDGIHISDGAAAWLHLREVNPALRGCYLRHGGTEIISNSPELFLEIDPHDRTITSIPIKGTAAISGGRASLDHLECSQKERAELTMIVDLVRNDLGRIAKTGTVKARDRTIRQCGDLWHAEQVVNATLADDRDAVDAMSAAFPPGSVTGAPKVRAMEVIRALEARPRGVYTGAIGWFGDGGGAHFNVAIRTATVVDGVGRFHVGAGIVADSAPEHEWAETLAKADRLATVLGA